MAKPYKGKQLPEIIKMYTTYTGKTIPEIALEIAKEQGDEATSERSLYRVMANDDNVGLSVYKSIAAYFSSGGSIKVDVAMILGLNSTSTKIRKQSNNQFKGALYQKSWED